MFSRAEGSNVGQEESHQHGRLTMRIDRIREEIGWLKLVFGVLVAIDVSMLSWLAENYSDANSVLSIAGLLATIGVSSAIVWVNLVAYRRIEGLEEL